MLILSVAESRDCCNTYSLRDDVVVRLAHEWDDEGSSVQGSSKAFTAKMSEDGAINSPFHFDLVPYRLVPMS